MTRCAVRLPVVAAIVLLAGCGGGGDAGGSGGSGTPIPANVAPVARATISKPSAFSSETIVLNGSGSTDSDGTIASYQWLQISGTTATLSSSTGVSTNVLVPPLAQATTLRFRLTVTDNIGATASTEVAIDVSPADVQFAIGVGGAPAFVIDDQDIAFNSTTPTFAGGGVSAQSMVWSSSLTGPFGAAPSVTGVKLSAGTHTITLRADFGVLGTTSRSMEVIVLPRMTSVPPALAAPATGHTGRIPVVIMNFLPTKDGRTLDASLWNRRPWPAPAELGQPATVALAQQYIRDTCLRIKFALEERSRFRGYKNAAALPYLGYEILAIYNFYEPLKRGNPYPGSTSGIEYLVDMPDVMAKVPARDLVENRGVKEFWLGFYEDWQVDQTLIVPESNMASPVTGDVSNSHRIPDDLPVFNKTYVVHALNYFRTQAEAVHAQGHQLEAMLTHAATLQDGNSNLFWRQFVGNNASGVFVPGRCGSVHYPINGRYDYDYANSSDVVLSDCEDWKPDGSGVKLNIDLTTWTRIPYQWPMATFPQKDETQWYVYWGQNMPGAGNTIPYGSTTMENWWIFVANWDTAMTAPRLGLHK